MVLNAGPDKGRGRRKQEDKVVTVVGLLFLAPWLLLSLSSPPLNWTKTRVMHLSVCLSMYTAMYAGQTPVYTALVHLCLV